jgi:hypothetical protein
MPDYRLFTVKQEPPALWLPSTVGFSPGEPLRPSAPGEQPRAFDYPVSRNIQIVPRSAESRPVTYEQMRALSRTYGILRTVIEQRKDEIKGLDWQIAVRKEYANQGYDVKAEQTFWERPDLEHTFDSWIGMLAEDHFVCDAPAIYKERDRAGRFRALQITDGTKILVLTDDMGHVPNAPQMGYEQVIKGMPRTGYCRPRPDPIYVPDDDNNLYELYYRPYNLASDGVYGFSKVESIIMIINIALRRDTSFLEWFRSGNVPAGIVQLTEEMQKGLQPEGYIELQKVIETLLSGDLKARSQMHILPGVGGVQMLQQMTFDGIFDEWLARVVCANFGISPAPYVRMMNRATAETQEESRQEYSLIPLLQFFKSWFDEIICNDSGKPYLEFIWTPGANYDKDRASMNNDAMSNGVKTIDDVRGEQGLEPLPDGLGSYPMVRTGSGPVLLADVISGKFQPSVQGQQGGNLGQPQGLPMLSIAPEDETDYYPELSLKSELDAWEKFTLNRLGKKALREFETKAIPAEMKRSISGKLAIVHTPEAIKALFDGVRQGLGRRTRTPAVEGTLNELIKEYESRLLAPMLDAKAKVEATL